MAPPTVSDDIMQEPIISRPIISRPQVSSLDSTVGILCANTCAGRSLCCTVCCVMTCGACVRACVRVLFGPKTTAPADLAKVMFTPDSVTKAAKLQSSMASQVMTDVLRPLYTFC